MNPESSNSNGRENRSNSSSWAHNFRADRDSIFSSIFCGSLSLPSPNDRYFPTSPQRAEPTRLDMRRMNSDGAPARSSPTFDARNVSDDRINPDDGTPKAVSSGRGLGMVKYETTADGDVVVVEPSFDAEDPASVEKKSLFADDGTSAAIAIGGDAKKFTHAPSDDGATLSKKRSHSRNLSEHFNEATNLKKTAVEEGSLQHLQDLERQGRFYNDPSSMSNHGPPSYGMHAPAPSAGQKHRRVFSGDISNPPSAHRRINSIGNAAVIKRRSFIKARQHQRVDSAGLEILTAAAESSREELEAAAGRRPAYTSHHHHQWEPTRAMGFPHPPDNRRPPPSDQYYPSDYGRGPMSMHLPTGQQHPLSHPHMRPYQHPIPHAPPSQYFRPPPTINRQSAYGHGGPYQSSASYFPPAHHHGGGYPTRHEHHLAPPPSSSAHYPVQYARSSPPYASVEKMPPTRSDLSSAGPTVRQASPDLQHGDDRIAMDEKSGFASDQRKAPWRDAVPRFGEDQHYVRESGAASAAAGHHRKMSSFSNLGAIFNAETSALDQSNLPKAAHHRSTSSSMSFLQNLEVSNFEGSDVVFLQNLQASSGAPPSTFTGPYISRNLDSKPSPTRSSPSAVASSEGSTTGSYTKLASGGTSKRVRRKCTVADCPNRVVQGGLCISHGAKRKTCKHPGCKKNVKKAGLCSTHGPARKRCEADGCSKVAVQGGRCIAHGAKKKLCSMESCAKQAILGGMCKKHHDLYKTTNEDAANDLHCRPIDSPLAVSTPEPDSKPHKPTHTRGLSIFQELSSDAIGSLLQNPEPTTGAPDTAAEGVASRTRHRSAFSRDFGSLYE